MIYSYQFKFKKKIIIHEHCIKAKKSDSYKFKIQQFHRKIKIYLKIKKAQK